MKKKIMLMARDPGGANTLVPLVSKLKGKGFNVLLYGKDMALQCYEQRGMEGKDIAEFMDDITINNWKKYLKHEKPDFIITGTSGDDFSERYLWKAAEETGITTFAILDQWINYGIRFSPYTPREQEQYQLNRIHPYLPDRILVMDDWARQAIINEGIEAGRILISGQPHFDFLRSQRRKITNVQTADFRRKNGIREDDFLITYISEPLSQDYRMADSSDLYWGYDEHSICQKLLSTLAEINGPKGARINFMVKQHPREEEGSYACLKKRFSTDLIKVEILRTVDTMSLLIASDLVCGISSMLLLEAILYGRPIISVQIGLKRKTPLVLAQQGIMQPIHEQEELKKVLQAVLMKHYIPGVKWQMEAGAVDKAISYMEEFL